MSQRELLTFASAAMALMALGIDTMLPAFDEMRATFGLDEGAPEIGNTITSYLFGTAVAQLVWGPLSDRFGRRPILYAGLVVYVAGAIASAMAPTLGTLFAARFLWGFGAGGPRVVVTAIVRDTTVGDAMAQAMSRVMAVFVLVPIVAPAAGAAIVAVAPWQTIFWICAIAGILLGFWAIRLPETLDDANRRSLEPRELVVAARRVAQTAVTFRSTMAAIAIQGAMTLYLTTSERIVGEIYGREAWFPFVFGAIATGLAVAAIINGRLVGRYGLSTAMRGQAIAAVTIAVVMALSTIVFDPPNFYVFHVLLGLTIAMFMMLMPNLNAAGMFPMGDMAGTASSVTSAARLGIGSFLATVATAVMGTSIAGFAIATTIFVAITTAYSLATPRISSAE
jgi:DHA1 family bicyclomycin/chloramphenicol resistance-like MFS transporter